MPAYLDTFSATLHFREQVLTGELCELTSTGAFFAVRTKLRMNDFSDNTELSFKFEGKQYRIPVRPTWHRQIGSSHQPAGFSMQFTKVDCDLLRALRLNRQIRPVRSPGDGLNRRAS